MSKLWAHVVKYRATDSARSLSELVRGRVISVTRSVVRAGFHGNVRAIINAAAANLTRAQLHRHNRGLRARGGRDSDQHEEYGRQPFMSCAARNGASRNRSLIVAGVSVELCHGEDEPAYAVVSQFGEDSTPSPAFFGDRGGVK